MWSGVKVAWFCYKPVCKRRRRIWPIELTNPIIKNIFLQLVKRSSSNTNVSHDLVPQRGLNLSEYIDKICCNYIVFAINIQNCYENLFNSEINVRGLHHEKVLRQNKRHQPLIQLKHVIRKLVNTLRALLLLVFHVWYAFQITHKDENKG